MAEIIIAEIVWSDSARLSFDKIIAYLKKNRTEKEIQKFINRTTEVLNTLKCTLKCAGLLLKEST